MSEMSDTAKQEFEALPTWLQELWSLSPRLARQAEADLKSARGNGWVSVKERLPEKSDYVLARTARWTLRALYILPRTIEAHEDDDDPEYDEEKDTYWAKPGWCEENQYEDVHWRITDEVTHWQPLPEPPKGGS